MEFEFVSTYSRSGVLIRLIIQTIYDIHIYVPDRQKYVYIQRNYSKLFSHGVFNYFPSFVWLIYIYKYFDCFCLPFFFLSYQNFPVTFLLLQLLCFCLCVYFLFFLFFFQLLSLVKRYYGTYLQQCQQQIKTQYSQNRRIV